MSKRPIAWHEQGAENLRQSVERKQQEFERVRRELERMRDDLQSYLLQIETAKVKGKDGFDSERFMK